MRRRSKTHMKPEERKQAQEIEDVTELSLMEASELVNLAKRHRKTIEWKEYVRDLDERVRRILDE